MNDDRSPVVPARRLPDSVTQARIGLGRAGCGLTTAALLDFQLDHARARDAVHAALDIHALRRHPVFADAIVVDSAAPSRAAYLQNPDLGRRLAPDMAARLARGDHALAIVIGDGLSAQAVQRHASATVEAVVAQLPDWHVAPPVIVRHARVAIGDEIGELLGAELVLVLLGERPGLSAPDSLGAYITHAPRIGRRDSERNCVSNIRPPHGLSYAEAGQMIGWLLREARRRGLSGVELKDESAATFLPPQV
ncbi:ethanolamine ammonia-lyase subunit EutC [Sphingomonas sp. MG17]|uniref:Ethanolamine ammonia-lyase small subunit n=1 Tax=Sphingomonas tagetis TaxID=2949092 RepID=A0A9X2KPU0_9SPHN|nr:ethanolamine ammonia-lyase subunit EutC [Sphingomonas tagetis]MCP3731053.1 ethanolamine ammonia-lyase subunit EutC [Sphingomonas tagetis]